MEYGRTTTACGHCWHPTGNVKLRQPMLVEEVCCKCGEKADHGQWMNAADPIQHGPFAPHTID